MFKFLTQPSTSRYIIGVLFILAGTLHLVKPGVYVRIMPAYMPYHQVLVFISGIAEILGGMGVLISRTQVIAGWGLILLLIAVFPANIDMTIQALRHQGWQSIYFIATVLRLPLQFILMYWIYWSCIQH